MSQHTSAHNQHSVIATIFIVMFVSVSGLQAQTVYKCGNSYSQSPCPGAEAIQASDPRSPDQKLQAEAATRRDAQQAQFLEKQRLAQEKLPAVTKVPKPRTPTAASGTASAPDSQVSSKIAPKKIRKKTTQTQGFVAQVPGSAPKPTSKVKPKKKVSN